ncbi:hypothetical protein [Roseateles sp. P5_E7]
MRPVDAATKWSLGFGMFAGLGPVLVDSLPWSVWHSNPNLAAWVQAYGSVAAIAAAAWFGGRQVELARRHEQERRDQDDLRRLAAVRVLLLHLYTTVSLLQRGWVSNEGDDEAGRFIAVFSSEPLREVGRAISQLPLFEVPSSELALCIAPMATLTTSFAELWDRCVSESESQGDLQYPAADLMEDALKNFRAQISRAGSICEREMHRLMGRPDLAAQYVWPE